MLTISDFLKIADRMSAQYQEMLDLEAVISPTAGYATLTIDPTGSNNILIFTAVEAGSDGNLISVTYRDPAANNATLSVTVTGNDIVFNLATNSSGVITSTANDIKGLLQYENGLDELVTIANSGAGTGVVTAISKSYLAGALHGLYADIVENTDEEVFIVNAANAAILLDTEVTAANMAAGVADFSTIISNLRSYFTAVHQSDLIDGFLEDNDARVHKNFDTLHNVAIGSHLDGKNVFTPEVKDVAVIDLSDAGPATLTIAPSNTKAVLTIDPTGTNNTIKFTAVTAGTSGNAINVTYTDPAANSQPLYIEVEGKDINVHLATNSSGVITSTAQDIITAVGAHTAAAALVTATAVGTVTGVVTAIPQTYLQNAQAALLYTAVLTGSEGNEISVQYTDPATSSQSLSVTVTNQAINVHLATDSSSVITTTGQDIITAIQASTAASALVTVAAAGDETNLVAAVAQTFLSGGTTATISTNSPLGVGDGTVSDTNYAAQGLRVLAYPTSKAAYLILSPTNTHAQLLIDTPGSNNTLKFTAVAAGSAGNSVQIQIIYTQVPSTVLSVSVTGNLIKVTLATSVASVITSTAANVATAVNANSSANVLVTTTTIGSGTGVLGSGYPVTNLTTTHARVKYTAKTAGIAGENITVRYVDPGAASQSLSVSVASNAITVNLATDSGSNITSTAADIIAAVNANSSANVLVTASEVIAGQSDAIVAAQAATNLDYGAGPNLRRDTTLNLTLTDEALAQRVVPITFTAGTTPGTATVIPNAKATLTIDPAGSNDIIQFTAVNAGTAGNNITIEYSNPATPKSARSILVTGNAIKISLESDYNSRLVSTAEEVVNAVNADSNANVLVQAALTGSGKGYLAEISPTHLSGGKDSVRFYGVESVQLVSGGEGGDQFKVNQIVERIISL